MIRQFLNIVTATIVILTVILLPVAVTMRGAGQKDYVRLEEFMFQAETGILNWRSTEGTLDASGNYRAEGEPLDCQISLQSGTVRCGNAEHILQPDSWAHFEEDVAAVAKHLTEMTEWPEDVRAKQ